MKTASLLAKVVLAAVSFSAFAAAAQSRVFDVRQFGARGDGKTLDTAAIQKALDECGKAGGGTVKLSPGVYLSQPITLRTRTTLLIEEGATLKATDDPKDYLPADVTWDEILNQTKKGPFTPFIGGKDLQDVTITGRGTIDGSGERWWAPAMEAKQPHRPDALQEPARLGRDHDQCSKVPPRTDRM
jgi:polygalacturonase